MTVLMNNVVVKCLITEFVSLLLEYNYILASPKLLFDHF